MKAVAVDFLSPSGATALKELGLRLAAARKRRTLRQADMAKRTLMSLTTYRKLEQGDPKVAIGNYVAALLALGLEATLSAVAAPEADHLTTQHTVSSVGRVRATAAQRRTTNDF